MRNDLVLSALLAALAPHAPIAAQDPAVVLPKPRVAWTQELASPSFGGAAVADIDGDGRLEVAFGTYFGDNSVRVLNGEDGSEYWRFDLGYETADVNLHRDRPNDAHQRLQRQYS